MSESELRAIAVIRQTGFKTILKLFTINLLSLGALIASIAKYFQAKSFDTLGSPLLFKGGDLAIQIALVFIFQFMVTSLSVGYFLSGKLENPSPQNEQKEQNKFNEEKIASSFVTLGCSLFLTTLNYYHFYFFGTSVLRTYSLMGISGVFIITLLALEFKNNKGLLRLHSIENTYSVGLLFFGATYSLRNSLINTRLAFFTLALFLLMAVLTSLSAKVQSSPVIFQYRNPFVVILSLCFLFHSRLYGDVKNLHAFESFSVSNSQLLNRGQVPWRDFGVQHGLWDSGLREYLGGLFTDNTIWGQLNASSALINPIVVALSGLCIMYLSKNLAITVVVVALDSFIQRSLNFTIFSSDMFPVFLIVVALKKYFANPRNRKLVAVSILSGFAIIWNPELIFFTSGTGLAIFIFLHISGVHYKGIIRTLFVFIFATVGSLIALTQGLFVSMFNSIKLDGSGYLFAWGMNYQWQLGASYFFFFFAVPLLLFVFLTFISAGFFGKKMDVIRYLHILPVSALSLYLYLKFLNWADWHLTQPTNVALVLVLLLFILHKNALKLAGTSVFLLIIISVPALVTSISDLSYRKSQSIDTVVGSYDPSSLTYLARVREVNTSFTPYLPQKKGVTLLDLGNEPVTWYGILNYKTMNGLDKVLNIASREAQLNVVARLEKQKPDAVVWGGEFGYWNNIFNGTLMRQYEIVRFVLENYTPVASNGKYVLLLPNEKGVLDLNARNKMIEETCDWFNGAPSFEPPISKELLLKGRKTREYRSGESFTLNSKSQFRSLGFTASSLSDNSITLQGIGETRGVIKFTVEGKRAPNFVWLASCPAWYYQHGDSRWLITSEQNTAFSLEASSVRD